MLKALIWRFHKNIFSWYRWQLPQQCAEQNQMAKIKSQKKLWAQKCSTLTLATPRLVRVERFCWISEIQKKARKTTPGKVFYIFFQRRRKRNFANMRGKKLNEKKLCFGFITLQRSAGPFRGKEPASKSFSPTPGRADANWVLSKSYLPFVS